MERLKQAGSAVAVVAALGLFMIGSSQNVQSYHHAPSPSVSKPMNANATILFGGDLMFDRSIRIAMMKNGDDHVFSCIDDMLKDVDLVVANLEGPITSYPSKSMGSTVGGEGNYTFTFPTSTAVLLARHTIRLVNLGNNHIMNFGREGLAETKQWLDSAGVGYFGDPDLLESERVE